MVNLSFNLDNVDHFEKKLNFWQLLENKSAFTEGLLASEILFLNKLINLKISAHQFFATKSPLENFLSSYYYLSPIRTELDYIEQRVKLISECRKLLTNFSPNCSTCKEIEDIIWLLRFQLYGFAQNLIENEKVMYGLIALKEAGVLDKAHIRQKLQELAQNNPKFASIVSEFI